MTAERALSGWGRYPVLDCRVETPQTLDGLRQCLGNGPMIARGAGRSYGDSALNPDLTVSMARFNRMLNFDSETGLLAVEAGVVLGDVISVFLPRGWFVPVSPGTKFVTIGGMVASDVHGKNHHKAGSFGSHVVWLDLLVADGSVVRCSPTENADLFNATVGGMGLTGIILRVAFHLMPVESGWIRQLTVVARDLDAVMTGFEDLKNWTYSVAWIDCLASGKSLGRSVMHLGEHALYGELDERRRKAPFATPDKPLRRFPFDAPSWALNRLTVGTMNALYFQKGQWATDERLIDWDTYFYPLDSILEWNRAYGRRGFIQFQCVVPLKTARAALGALLTETAATGQGSFLAVLKLFGPQDSLFSFPMEGYTLALDFPATPKALALVERLDRITLDHGGRFYLSKDGRMQKNTFAASDPRERTFRAFREEIGASRQFRSAQSQRLEL